MFHNGVRSISPRKPQYSSQVQASLHVTKRNVLWMLTGGVVPRGGSPPLVPMWPGARVVERNPFPFFPFNPRWQRQTSMTREDLEVFCALLKLAWVSDRPGYLPPDRVSLS